MSSTTSNGFALWDTTSANMVGYYATLDEAKAVREATIAANPDMPTLAAMLLIVDETGAEWTVVEL